MGTLQPPKYSLVSAWRATAIRSASRLWDWVYHSCTLKEVPAVTTEGWQRTPTASRATPSLRGCMDCSPQASKLVPMPPAQPPHWARLTNSSFWVTLLTVASTAVAVLLSRAVVFWATLLTTLVAELVTPETTVEADVSALHSLP